MQGHIEGRIAELEGKIPALQIIDPKTLQAGDRIVFGATVELEDEDGKVNVYQIVGDDEADIKENRISISSPVDSLRDRVGEVHLIEDGRFDGKTSAEEEIPRRSCCLVGGNFVLNSLSFGR